MDQNSTNLLARAKQLFQEKKYQEVIEILPDDILERTNDPALYSWKARSLSKNLKIDQSYKYAQKAIEINPFFAMGYFARGNTWANKQLYEEAIEDYDQAISLDETIIDVYLNRGLVHSNMKEYEAAIEDYNKAISLDGKYAESYNKKANAWYNLKEYNKAIKDYTKAISLDKKNPQYYNNRGNIWILKKEYVKAITDYNRALGLNSDFIEALNNRGIAWLHKKNYKKAIEDFNKSLSIDDKYDIALKNRAFAYKEIEKYHESLKDYERYLELTSSKLENYPLKVTLDQIEELRKKIQNLWYEEIDKCVEDIKKILFFENLCLTHFTSLSAAKAMILDESPFRLSEGAFLNDTSEGRELSKFLSFSLSNKKNDDTIAEIFFEKPFIGSFVADNKHDDLTLWRMYGKEEQAEAKGCAITILREPFIKTIEDSLSPNNYGFVTSPQREQKFTFYRVAYRNDNIFYTPGISNIQQEKLNKLMLSLKEKMNLLTEEQTSSVMKLLNEIAYLFKSADYQFENEVRLVVQGVGFRKEIDRKSTPPKVYINLVNIIPVLNKITLGPKVERADEWAAAFNYFIEERSLHRDKKVGILISHLPFK